MFRILIADDEPIERKIMSKILLDNFCEKEIECIEAENGQQVLEIFHKMEIEIAFLDIEMPGMNGLEAAVQIRKLNSKCKIIFLTAFDEFDYAKKAISVHAMEYILKPTSEEEVVAVVHDAIINIRKEDRTKYMSLYNREELTENSVEKLGNIRMESVQKEMVHFIHEHYREGISLADAAEHMNYSNVYFCKLFKHCFHKNFTTFLTEYRVEKAKDLLIDMTINVKDVGSKIGYPDSNYFTKVFRRVEGMTPSEYRILMLERIHKEGKYEENRTV